MASIHREVVIDAEPDVVWDALRDWGALHERLAVGFATEVRREADARIVTFASGVTLREEIVDVDDARRRLAWSIVDGSYSHHNGAAQVLTDPDGRTQFVWIADLRPDSLADATAEAMDQGIAAIKRTLELTTSRTR